MNIDLSQISINSIHNLLEEAENKDKYINILTNMLVDAERYSSKWYGWEGRYPLAIDYKLVYNQEYINKLFENIATQLDRLTGKKKELLSDKEDWSDDYEDVYITDMDIYKYKPQNAKSRIDLIYDLQ